MSPRRRVDVWNRVAMFVTLVGIWVLLWDDVSVLSIVSGFLVALLITRVFYLPPVEFSNRVNPWFVLVFLLRLLVDIAVASVRVSWQILTLPVPVHNAIVAVHLRSRSEGMLVWTTEAVSLVPGSLVIDVDPQLNVLYLHVLGVTHDEDERIEEVRRTVLESEARIVRAIGSREDVQRVNQPLDRGAGAVR
ncbi:Na+/H+ antiporter subunit E [Rathayibacter tanaceti]|uniref:Na+/H+ antiporter subunit E n=2 Tax=Rathayibacter tanaceti TaxID=1671680 RepID=A0A166D710_9MICO|nr:Na+/H+ antiporter subunit E [Rathayibacter tanaceti]KZX22027.1 putative monovalent cation/H+ antiporter subunit E [Rathayibacter tanaceti]QHC54723.1 Na+/H+ antiporter subunit E [Rathayibacter tanaceti]TCO37460.1 multicomponent Na+:H+ antiporter subunit E [Rathayibacter tanaceti]